jgi:cystathionine beta-synthase (O-acetyl-L-serine)
MYKEFGNPNMAEMKTTKQGVAADLLACIGQTPLVALDRYWPPVNGVQLAAKLEYLNPGGSVKDRIGVAMVRAAEAAGELRPGGTIVEATAGNTGIGLALAAAVLGYRSVFVIPERFSWEKRELLRALGAEVLDTPTSEGMEGALDRARELVARTPGAVLMQQFANPANPAAHYVSTGPEIWEQTAGQVRTVVIGAGSGGTFTGTVRYLKERRADLWAVLVQPYGASLGEGYQGPHKTEGIGVDKVSAVPVLDRTLIDEVIVVRDEDAHAAVRDLARREAMLVGSSSGSAAHAARLVAQRGGAAGLVVTLLPDGADRYLSQHIYGAFEEWTT